MKSVQMLLSIVALMFSTVMFAGAGEDMAVFDRQILFEAGPERDYRVIRIPCILALPDDTVLAVAAGRSSASDWADIRMIMRRSTDGGKTWGPLSVLIDRGKNVADNPVLIWDAPAKTVHFLHQVNYERIYHMTSTDSGKTWSEPVDITPQLSRFQQFYKWNVIAPGPGHGIQLENGRLIIPVWLANGAPEPSGKGIVHRPSVATSIYSDDHGKTWRCGEIMPDVLKNMSETVAVPAADGGVWFYIRNEEIPAFKIGLAYSKDGATNWTKAELQEDLYQPICFSSVLRISGAPDKSRILFCNPDSRTNPKPNRGNPWRARENLTLRMSYDEGKTWPVVRVLEPRHSSYSDLTMLSDGTILCLFEHDNRYISVARFNLAWLTDRKDALRGGR
ncbi:MAG: glycoside hydrolase [Opitutaceae bacterium]|nr:glycoside hydrolase [Opitutaceae bacterium]